MTMPEGVVSERLTATAGARIAPLASLPVFFALAGKCAVVVGGGAAAAWKAELLAAAGARVEIIAVPGELSTEMRGLIASYVGPGALFIREGPWQPAMLRGAVLAVAELDKTEEAERFAAAACRLGVPFNVIDKPEFCRFQFGVVVNRSPVVVGISTAGAAPILGQAIRRRIEAVLPAGLAGWAARASAIRATVTARLAPGRPRRLFWERLATAAFRLDPTFFDVEALVGEISAGREARGAVVRLAVHPQESDLLTLAAIRELQSADIIYFDAAIAPGVLELARREARRIAVGSVTVEAEMAELAADGVAVLRLTALPTAMVMPSAMAKGGNAAGRR